MHSAVDGYSRLAYSEVLDDEQGTHRGRVLASRRGVLRRARHHVERVLTDNGACYRSRDFAAALGDITHTRTRPYRPATNGKVERFNRTLLAEWAYARPWTSEGQRTRALTTGCTATTITATTPRIGGPPITRVSNLPGHYI